MKKIIFLHPIILLLAACDNPGGISDKDYAEYTELGAPKILYACTAVRQMTISDLEALMANVKALQACLEIKVLEKQKECVKKNTPKEEMPITIVEYRAGIGPLSTYNKILTSAKDECRGEFKVLEGEQ